VYLQRSQIHNPSRWKKQESSNTDLCPGRHESACRHFCTCVHLFLPLQNVLVLKLFCFQAVWKQDGPVGRFCNFCVFIPVSAGTKRFSVWSIIQNNFVMRATNDYRLHILFCRLQDFNETVALRQR